MKVKSIELCMQNNSQWAQGTELESGFKSEDIEIWQHGSEDYEACEMQNWSELIP